MIGLILGATEGSGVDAHQRSIATHQFRSMGLAQVPLANPTAR